MYLGLLLVLLGYAVYLAAIYSLSGPSCFVLYLHWFQIRPEEVILVRKIWRRLSRLLPASAALVVGEHWRTSAHD